jgi:hypothetical protein
VAVRTGIEPQKFLITVAPNSGVTRWRRQKALSLVKPDGLDADAARRCELTDG